jgi:hypothetical protein
MLRARFLGPNVIRCYPSAKIFRWIIKNNPQEFFIADFKLAAVFIAKHVYVPKKMKNDSPG